VVFADRDGGPGLLFINVKPGSLATGQITWSEVAAGGADDYLNAIGRELRRYDRPLFMTLHHEPEDEVDPTPGSGQTAADYVAMFRHAVDQVESQAPDAQITWVWNVTGYPRWESLWPQLYPGDHYVDWIAYDPYLQEPAGCDISCVVNRTYQEFPEWDGFYAWATERYPGKTLMLGEWGVRESPDDALAKAELFRSAPAILANDFPGLRALVYFNDDKSPDDPTSTRLETSAASLEAFRETVAHPYLSSAARKAPRS
jgi:beta-mannanase